MPRLPALHFIVEAVALYCRVPTVRLAGSSGHQLYLNLRLPQLAFQRRLLTKSDSLLYLFGTLPRLPPRTTTIFSANLFVLPLHRFASEIAALLPVTSLILACPAGRSGGSLEIPLKHALQSAPQGLVIIWQLL